MHPLANDDGDDIDVDKQKTPVMQLYKCQSKQPHASLPGWYVYVWWIYLPCQRAMPSHNTQQRYHAFRGPMQFLNSGHARASCASSSLRSSPVTAEKKRIHRV